ncbi:MAG: cob(I)yrinic acid a,c-diamide adenosyltransferase [Dehalococcoidales bacterium]|jgi:ATP:corrinoid adenosyltransferase|nr:cob(I)yrinic acid a,c-diamide adenosyltransferase [Dehalococcoidales bacterium]MDP7285825.1 cob(I)yrinic acid a,c-diamide adenosyltransferase [Dehalococcoidales bacterium]MDP7415577.1 cob(I)yrinic acid a,c-diamide adenosyltransferase [Dehalococcoidales bacterium]
MAGNAIPVTGCGKYDLVVLDEVIRLIQDKPEKIELILTGRYADARLGSFAGLD